MREHLIAEKAEQFGSVISNIVENQKFIIFFGEPEMSERQIKTYLLAPHIYKATNNWRDIQYNGKPLFKPTFEKNFEKNSNHLAHEPLKYKPPKSGNKIFHKRPLSKHFSDILNAFLLCNENSLSSMQRSSQHSIESSLKSI